MIKYLISVIIFTFALIQNAFPVPGDLFLVQESGTILEAPTTLTICANIKGPISCQKYTITYSSLAITTRTNHNYPYSGIKVDSSSLKIMNCSVTINGYCSLPLSSQTPTNTFVTTVAVQLKAVASMNTEVGIAYNQENIATGGTKPYTFSVSSGVLPVGTSLNSTTGTVSGTPTTLQAFNYSIKVTDAKLSIAIAETNGMVNAALSTSTPSNTTVDAGQTASFSTTASNGTMPYSY